MDYKNFKYRSFISIFMLVSFLYINYYNGILLSYLFLIIYVIIFIEIYKNFKTILYNFYIYLYLVISIILLQIYFYYYYDYLIFTYFIFLIIIFDTSSYLGGSLFGKKKILPKISPGKTYIGLVSGIIFCLFFLFIYTYLNAQNNYFEMFFIAFFVILFSFVGDTRESYLKRLSKIKDSSNFLPGHGGFFDRFDSFIFSVYFLFIYEFFKNI